MRNRGSKVSKIQPVRKGPFVHVRKGNELVHAVNALLNLQGRDGLEVHRAEAGFVISVNNDLKEQIASGGGGVGSLNWKGPWASGTTYQTGDIVIRATPELMQAGKAGTFVSKVDDNQNHEPPTLPDLENDHWAVFGKGSWDRIYVRDMTGEAGQTDLVGGRAHFDFGDASRADGWDQVQNPETTGFPSAKVRFWPLLHNDQKGRLCTWREVYAVDPESVTARRLWIMAMEEGSA